MNISYFPQFQSGSAFFYTPNWHNWSDSLDLPRTKYQVIPQIAWGVGVGAGQEELSTTDQPRDFDFDARVHKAVKMTIGMFECQCVWIRQKLRYGKMQLRW